MILTPISESYRATLPEFLAFILGYAELIVLCSAEELGWPLWFDDPLPRQGGGRAKVRCHDTIKDLNRRQTPHLIHFKGDGTGMRIGWEYR
jgi:hypothetical protein